MKYSSPQPAEAQPHKGTSAMSRILFACHPSLRILISLSICCTLLLSVVTPLVGASQWSSAPTGQRRMLNSAGIFPVAGRSKSRLQGEVLAASRSNELLVRFRAGASQQDKDTVIATQGARRKKQLRGESGVEKLELPGGRDVRTAAQQFMLNPQVEFAEPNFLISKDDLSPNDPRFNEQWALRNTGQNGGQYGSDVDVNGAWQTTTGSAATVVAVIDSGIDFTHPDLAGNQLTKLN